MRIASVEVIPYALPFREPYVTAAGRLERREMVLLRLWDEDGLVGLGEAVPLSLRGGTKLQQVVEELGMLGGLEDLDEQALSGGMVALSAPGRCAATTALLDLRGRRAAAEGHASMSPPATRVALQETGAGDDAAMVRAVREALGPRALIRVDANGAWDVETAKRTLGELEPYEIELAEQPVATMEEAAEVASATTIPLAADESVESRADAERAAKAGAFAMTGVKLSKVGGPEAAIEIAEALPAYMTSALDGPVGIAAAAQVAATLGEVRQGDNPPLAQGLATQRLFTSTIASIECELRGDLLQPPPGPGLGVEIDEAALERHRL